MIGAHKGVKTETGARWSSQRNLLARQGDDPDTTFLGHGEMTFPGMPLAKNGPRESNQVFR